MLDTVLAPCEHLKLTSKATQDSIQNDRRRLQLKTLNHPGLRDTMIWVGRSLQYTLWERKLQGGANIELQHKACPQLPNEVQPYTCGSQGTFNTVYCNSTGTELVYSADHSFHLSSKATEGRIFARRSCYTARRTLPTIVGNKVCVSSLLEACTV